MNIICRTMQWYWDWKIIIHFYNHRRVVNAQGGLVTILGQPFWWKEWPVLMNGCRYE